MVHNQKATICNMTKKSLDPQLKPKLGTKILGMGTIVVDHIVELDGTLSPGEKHEVTSSAFQIGGPVPTGLALLKKYGIDCHFLGSWGLDNHGLLIQSHLDEIEISSTRPEKAENIQSGFAHVWINKQTGDRTISAFRGSSEPELEPIIKGQHDNNCILYLDGWPADKAIEAGKLAKSRGWPVFMDLGSPKPNLESVIGTATWLNCPKSLIKRAWGIENVNEGGNKILSLGPDEVTITDGPNGSWFFSKSCSFHQPAAEIVAVDTNGAGDIFSAATLYSRISGSEPEELMRFATTVAALKCLKSGNSHSIPSLDFALEMTKKFPDICF